MTIAEIQGQDDVSPLAGRTVTTTGVVTAAYPTGGLDGLYVQKAGTGGDPADDATPGASDGVFVHSRAAAAELAVGDHVEVTGKVTEFHGLTEVSASSWTVLDDPAPQVKPTVTGWPATDAEREALEGMLLAPQDGFTVTDSYSTNQYGTVGLAAGGTWAYAASPQDVAADEDVIRNAFVYRTAEAEPVGPSRILDDPVAFGNARQPLAQVFQPAGGVDADTGDDVVVITNHSGPRGRPGRGPATRTRGTARAPPTSRGCGRRRRSRRSPTMSRRTPAP